MKKQDVLRASLAFQLMQAYDSATVSLKLLRANRLGERQMDPEEVEHHRFKATRFFNHIPNLMAAGLLDERLFALVIPSGAAELWIENVQPLDREVRKQSFEILHPGEPFVDRLNGIERFWACRSKKYRPQATEPAMQ